MHLDLKFTETGFGTLMRALMTRPYEEVVGLINDINRQVQALNPQAPEAASQ